MNGIPSYTNEQRSRVMETMTPAQVKVIKEFGRFLWKSFNLTIQYNNADDWVFEGVETNPFYKRGRMHGGENLQCDICGYHPIKDCYLLSSRSKHTIIGMGKSCFEEQISISGKTKKEIFEHKNEIDIFRDSIIRSYSAGKRFPIQNYQLAKKHYDFYSARNSDFLKRVAKFKEVNLPLYSRDDARLKRYAVQEKEIEDHRESKMEKQSVMSKEQREAVQTFVNYRYYYLQDLLEDIVVDTPWKYEDIIVGKFDGQNFSTNKCICGQPARYLVIVHNRYNQSVPYINPYHILRHSIVDKDAAERLIAQVTAIDTDWHEIMQGFSRGDKFPTLTFKHAFNNGYFNPDNKAEVLDYCEALKKADLPLPARYLHGMKEFVRKYNASLDGTLLTILNGYQMLQGMVETVMPENKRTIDVEKAITEYAANKAHITLPAVSEDKVQTLTYQEMESQLLYRKVELYMFYKAVEDHLDEENKSIVKMFIKKYIEQDLQNISVDDLNKLKNYLG